MPLRLPLPTAIRLWAVLLLAAIGLQAAAPVGKVLEARSGSAFSATTVEVAVAPQRRVEAQRQIALPQPATLPVAARITPAAPALASELAWAPRPDSTGPPAREILARQPAPRGPPTA